MATASINYASSAGITLTQTSLGNGSWRASTAVDNQTNKYLDALVGGSIQTGTLTAAGTIDIYLYASWDGTNYPESITGTDAAWTPPHDNTPASGTAIVFVASIVTGANDDDSDMEWGPVSVANAFGNMPRKWGVVIENNSGATTNATGTNNACDYTGIKIDSA